MKDQFVTYEIAKRLKELGFNEDCCAYFRITGSGPFYTDWKKHSDSPETAGGMSYVSAPLWQQAIDWLRERHKMYVVISPDMHVVWYAACLKYNTWKELAHGETFQEVRQAAIEKALTLIA